MKKTIEDLEITIDDNVSEEQELRIKKAWSYIELFSDYSSTACLIDKAITKGLAEVNFTLDYEAVDFGACHKILLDQSGIMQIDANAHPIDIIDGFFFELQNSINTKLNSITPAQYSNADEYADDMELAEEISFIEHQKLILEFIQSNNKVLEDLFIEVDYPYSLVSIRDEIKFKEKYFSSEELKEIFTHREFYVKQWLKWKSGSEKNEEYDTEFMQIGQQEINLQNKLLLTSNTHIDINSIIQKEEVDELEKVLSSSNQVIYSYHIDQAINLRNNKMLAVLLKNYKDEIYDFQINDLVRENNLELIKILLPNISNISGYTIDIASHNENIAALKLLLDKGEIYKSQLFSVKNEKIIEMVKNHPNYKHFTSADIIDSENHDQNLAGVILEDNSDFLS